MKAIDRPGAAIFGFEGDLIARVAEY
jgi:hypothetical protein